jgi:hypothetical protein
MFHLKLGFIPIILLTIFWTSCSRELAPNQKTPDLFSHTETDVYYKGELCAKLVSLEMAYDNRKIVREATFVLTDEKFSGEAVNILLYLRKKIPTWEIELEIRR